MDSRLSRGSYTRQATSSAFEDYQIVNGCQTSHVLFDQRETLDDSVTIPIRLISTKNDEITNAVIKATNWQTEVTEEQLFALQEFPKSLELFFDSYPVSRRLYFERRDGQYDTESIEKTRVITFSTMIKAFAAMFLNEPHRTTRNFKGIKAKVGKEIFTKGQRMEPYYVAALALYKVEWYFRNGRLSSIINAAKFQMLLVIRILTAGYVMPDMNANKMESYCKLITAVLDDAEKTEEVITKAAAIVLQAAEDKSLDRDTVRTEPFTESVISLTPPAEKKW